MLVLLNKKVTKEGKDLWKINKQKKWFWTNIMPETKSPQMFMFSWLYIGLTSEPSPNWTKPLQRGLVTQRDSCNVTSNPNKSMWMPPMLYTNWVFFFFFWEKITKRRRRRRRSKSCCWVHTPLCFDLQSLITWRRGGVWLSSPFPLQLSFWTTK